MKAWKVLPPMESNKAAEVFPIGEKDNDRESYYHIVAEVYGEERALLIAAAPELLEALIQIVDDFEDLERGIVTQASINKAKRAIAEAEDACGATGKAPS